MWVTATHSEARKPLVVEGRSGHRGAVAAGSKSRVQVPPLRSGHYGRPLPGRLDPNTRLGGRWAPRQADRPALRWSTAARDVVTRTGAYVGVISQSKRGRFPVRVTAAFSRLLALPGIWVRDVEFTRRGGRGLRGAASAVLSCPECEFETKARYDRPSCRVAWRHSTSVSGDRGAFPAEAAVLPDHGWRTGRRPLPGPVRATPADLEDLVGFLATQMDKTAVWRPRAGRLGSSVGRMIPG